MRAHFDNEKTIIAHLETKMKWAYIRKFAYSL